VFTGRSLLTIDVTTVAGTYVLSVSGVLGGTTYIRLRDAIKQAALERPRAVIVDIKRLDVVGESAWAVFPAAHRYITEGPDVPMALVCNADEGRKALCRNGIGRYVPAYATVDAAITELTGGSEPRYRRACGAACGGGAVSDAGVS
jgi:anti-anti-sigma regulatory factor